MNSKEAREVYSSVDQTKKLKTKKKKFFNANISTNSGCRFKILALFHEFSSEDQKKRSSSQKSYEIRCESTKITKRQFLHTNSRVVNPNNLGVLDLDSHSSSPETVNFFGAQSSLGGGGHNFRLGEHKQSFGEAQPRNSPLEAQGLP